MVILNSSEDQGMFYVETKNLDGETNLKLKTVSDELIEHFGDDSVYSKLAGVINMEGPNNRIYKFDGNFDITHLLNQNDNSGGPLNISGEHSKNSNIIPLSNDNVALRGMSLRNTEVVTGVVVYTGHDSKIQ